MHCHHSKLLVTVLNCAPLQSCTTMGDSIGKETSKFCLYHACLCCRQLMGKRVNDIHTVLRGRVRSAPQYQSMFDFNTLPKIIKDELFGDVHAFAVAEHNARKKLSRSKSKSPSPQLEHREKKARAEDDAPGEETKQEQEQEQAHSVTHDVNVNVLCHGINVTLPGPCTAEAIAAASLAQDDYSILALKSKHYYSTGIKTYLASLRAKSFLQQWLQQGKDTQSKCNICTDDIQDQELKEIMQDESCIRKIDNAKMNVIEGYIVSRKLALVVSQILDRTFDTRTLNHYSVMFLLCWLHFQILSIQRSTCTLEWTDVDAMSELMQALARFWKSGILLTQKDHANTLSWISFGLFQRHHMTPPKEQWPSLVV